MSDWIPDAQEWIPDKPKKKEYVTTYAPPELLTQEDIEPYEKTEPSVGEFAWDYAKEVGRQTISGLSDLAKSYRSTNRVEQDAYDAYATAAGKASEEYIKKHGSDEQVLPGITKKDVAESARSLPFSLISAGTGLLAGMGTLAATKSPKAAWAAGGAASGVAAFRMSSAQVMRSYLEMVNENAIQQDGNPLTKDEQEYYRKNFEREAQKYGMWEAIPEAVGNVTELKLLIKPLVKMLGKNNAMKVIAKLGGIYGTELATETVTQMGQQGVEVRGGMQEGPERSFTKPGDWATSFKEIAPQTFILVSMMGGAGGAGMHISARKKANAIVNAVSEDKLGEVPTNVLEGVIQKAGPVIETRPWDKKLSAAVDAIQGEVERRKTAPQEAPVTEAPAEEEPETTAPEAPPEEQKPVTPVGRTYNTLSSEFFNDITMAVSKGQDREGNPFKLEDAEALLESYRNAPDADPASVAKFEKIVGTYTTAREARRQQGFKALADFKTKLTGGTFADDNAILDERQRLVDLHPHISDQLNRAVVEYQASKIKIDDEPSVAAPSVTVPVEPVSTSVQAPIIPAEEVKAAEKITPQRNIPEGETFYHGTAAEGEFDVFGTDVAYLAPNETEARSFAENIVLSKEQKGQERTLEVKAKAGKAKDITNAVDIAIAEDMDVDDVIKVEAQRARDEGFRYLEFTHPGTEEDYTATISLYPKEDLSVTPTPPKPAVTVERLDLTTKKPPSPETDLEGIRKANPMLFRAAQKATSVDKFINKISKGKPETVSRQVLADFYNKVNPPAKATPKETLLTKEPPGGWTEADKVPEKYRKPTEPPLGKNSEGQDVYEDKNGVRYVVENGIRLTESVAMVPTRKGVISKPETHIYKEGEKGKTVLKGKYTAEGQTEKEITEYGSKAPERKFKADLKQYAKKLREILGYEPERDKKGKDESVHTNIAPIGGDGIILLWKPNSEYGVYISIPTNRDYGDDSLTVEGTLGKSMTIMYRATTKADKWGGCANQWAPGTISAEELAEKIKNEVDFYDHVKGAKEIIQEAKDAGHSEEEISDAFREGEKIGEAQGANEQPEEIEKEITALSEEIGVTEIEPKGALSDYGITVTKGVTKNNNTVWNVQGNTQPHKETIKKLGGKWYKFKKAWSFYDADPTAKLLEALGGKQEAPKEAVKEKEAIDEAKVNAVVEAWKVFDKSPLERDKQSLVSLYVGLNELEKAEYQDIISEIKLNKQKDKYKPTKAEPAAVTPKDNWENNLIKAREYAVALNLTLYNEGKETKPLEQLVKEIKEKLAAKEKPAYGADNKIFTEDKANKARELLKKKLGGIHMGAPIDPEVIQAGIDLAGYHIEAGARSFNAYAKKMIQDIGEVIRPYLKSFYMAVRNYPGFDKTGMNTEAELDKIDENTIDIQEKESKLELEGGEENVTAITEHAAEEAGTPEDDRGRLEGKGAEAVSGVKEKRAAGEVRQEPGKGTDEQLRPRDERGYAPSEPRPEGAEHVLGEGASAGERIPAAVGRDAGDLAGVQRPERGRDYRIGVGELTREGGWKTAAKNNLDAIEIIKKLDAEKRPATPEEQSILAKYVGWGASELANNMFPGFSQTGEVRPEWGRKSDWKPLVERMLDLMTPEEIKTAAKSTQYAHYTSEPIIRSIYNALERFGFKGGKILEPGVGIGNFIGLLPNSMKKGTKYTGIEMDHITAKIAKALYPHQNIIQGDFTRTAFPQDFFDLSVGNPPFSNVKILADPEYKKNRFNLHEYFFAKSIDRTRPGGLLVFVTSRYAMDRVDDKARKYLAERADLIGAIRLPQTAFKQSAGTEVVTDVLFLRKRAPGETPAGQAWNELKEVTTPEGPANINEYFADHPEMVLGRHSLQGSMYQKNEYTVLPLDESIEDLFAKATEKLPMNVYDISKAPTQEITQGAVERDFNPKNKKEGGLYVGKDGKLMQTNFGSGALLDTKKLSPKDVIWLNDYVELRDLLKQAQYDQLNDKDWEASLEALKKAYKAFVKQHGRIQQFTISERKSINEDGEQEIIGYRKLTNERLWKMDVENSLVTALEVITEDGNILEGPFLQGRTIKKPSRAEVKTVPDALAVSMDEIGKLDLDHVAKTINMPKDAVIEQLGNLIFEVPGKGYVLSDEYLSGNVVKKLEEAKAAAKIDDKYKKNVEALENVQPSPLTAADITVNPASPWIPIEVYDDFIEEVLELKNMRVQYSHADNTWTVRPVQATDHWGRRRGKKIGVQGLRGAAGVWSTTDRGANELFEAVLNNSTLKITRTERTSGGTRTWTDAAATTQVNDIAKRMRESFNSWVWQDADRANELLDIYNTRINVYAGRRFDGSHLTLPGVSLRFKLHDHQKRAIWRIIQTGNTYLGHAVGAGKTAEMICAGMEMKRLGLIKKPLYVVPNHMLQQFANEFQEFYPLAHIMVADEENFHTDNRRRFVAQATLNNPDAIVMTHSSFGIVKAKAETIAPVRDALIQELRDSLEALEEEDANRFRIKKMENRIEQTEQRFDALVAGNKDQAVSFEEMGVDFLFVDEAHQFRKLDFTTNRQAKGIDSVGSQRAMDLYIKTKWLEAQNPGRSHVFASGTPVTNTMGELYSLMKFFIEPEMEREGIKYFDSWANMFGQVVVDTEMNAAGRYEQVERFSRFVNIPELMSRVRSFMDVVTMSQLGAFVQRPEIKGGNAEVVITPASDELKDYQTNVLQPRIRASRDWKPSKEQPGNPDPLINIITDGRLASIDMRFVRPGSRNDPNSKFNKFIDGIIQDYKDTKDLEYTDPATDKVESIKGGTQIVFYNLGLGAQVAKRRGFDGRAWIMKRLKQAGIPATEVAWIDDYSTAVKKEHVMKEMRQGKKRILIGSAKKMGTGINVQKRLAALNYMDPPWYPADVEQPDGRILRQGNQNKVVTIKRYATKGSYDATQWQMVARKSRSIEQAFLGDPSVRSMEDLSESSQYAMASALASGDERVIQLVGLQAEIEKLSRLKEAHSQEQSNLRRSIGWEEWMLESAEKRIKDLKEAEKVVPDYITKIDGRIGTRVFDNRGDFGNLLLSEWAKWRENAEPLRTDQEESKTTIGSLNGVKIIFSKRRENSYLVLSVTDNVSLSITDIVAGTSPEGLVTKMVNYLNRMSSERREAEDNKKEVEANLAVMKKRLGAPFEFSRDLAEKIAEASQLEAELLAEGTEAPTAPEGKPDEDTLNALRKQAAEDWDDETERDVIYPVFMANKAKAKAILSRHDESDISIAENLAKEAERSLETDEWSEEEQTEARGILDDTWKVIRDVRQGQQTLFTTGEYSLYSGIDITQTLKMLRGLKDNIKEALPHLEAIGIKVYQSGKTRLLSWRDGMRKALGDLWHSFKSVMGKVWDKVKEQRGNISITPKQEKPIGETADTIIKDKDKYQKTKMPDGEPTKNTSKEQLNEWIKDGTDALVQTAVSYLPSNIHHMSMLEKFLKSPEWYDHPVLSRIVRLFMRDRNELYHEYFNHLASLHEPGMEENTVIDLAKKLKHKGLTRMQILKGETSKEYKDLQWVIDYGDTDYVRNLRKSLPNQIKEFEAHIREKGISDDVIEVWKYYRQSYDAALDMMTAQMKEMIEAIEEEAAFKGISPADYSEMFTTLKGAMATMTKWKGFYAPRIRQGNWAVVAYRETDTGEREYYREQKWSQVAARTLSRKLERDGWKIRSVSEIEKLPEDVYQDIKTVDVARAIESAIENMSKGKMGEGYMASAIKFNEELLQEAADMIRARGFRASMIHRKVGDRTTRGYIEDPMERHLIYINNVSRGFAKSKVAQAAYNALMGTYIKGRKTETGYIKGRRFGGIDPKKEPRVYTVAKDYIEEQLRNLDKVDRWIGWAKSLATLKFLGFSGRAALVNTTAMVTTVPMAIHQYVMGGKGSLMKIHREIVKAGRDYGRVMATRKLPEGDEGRFLAEEHRLGWDDPQYTRDAMSNMQKIHNRAWAITMEGAMYMFGKTEQWNRGSAMLAAYRIARKQGKSHTEASEIAKITSDNAHGVYGRATLPSIAWGRGQAGKWAQMMYVYGKFSHNYLQMLYDVGVKKHNIKGFLYGFLANGLIGGVKSIAFAEAVFFPILGLILVALGAKDKDEKTEKWVWDRTREYVGKGGEIALRYGALGALGMDITGSLSIGVGIPRSWAEWAGPIGGMAKEGAQALHKAWDIGDYSKAAEHLLPSGFQAPVRAYREHKRGITTEIGKRVYDEEGKPYMPTWGETALRVAGVRSSKLAYTQERLYEAKEQAAQFKERRNDIYERYRTYLQSEERDPEEHRAIREDVREYNKHIKDLKLQGEAPLIKFESMKRQAKEMKRAPKRIRKLME